MPRLPIFASWDSLPPISKRLKDGVMTNEDVHHGIEFANRYALGTAQGNFNAATALGRLEALANDVERVDAALEIAKSHEEEHDVDWSFSPEIEAFSFYAVGIVTCLEWHARSRLTDLFSFMPGAISQDDLKPLANARMMAQMVENEVSAAQLLGGMTTVASAERYMSIMNRLFEQLSIPVKVHDLINAKSEQLGLFDTRSRKGIERLQRIFDFRNAFVHEIGIEISGSYVMRDILGASQALEWCRFAIDCVRCIEAEITTHAPNHFPNCLDERGYARSDAEALDRVIETLEEEISTIFENKDQGHEQWLEALSKTRAAAVSENKMSRELYTRFFENATPVRMSLRRGRLSYLKSVKNALKLLPDK